MDIPTEGDDPGSGVAALPPSLVESVESPPTKRARLGNLPQSTSATATSVTESVVAKNNRYPDKLYLDDDGEEVVVTEEDLQDPDLAEEIQSWLFMGVVLPQHKLSRARRLRRTSSAVRGGAKLAVADIDDVDM